MRTIRRTLLGAAIAASLLTPGAASAQSSGATAYQDFLVDIGPKFEVMTTTASIAGAQDIIDYLDANTPDACYVPVWLADVYAFAQVSIMALGDLAQADQFLDHMRDISDQTTGDLTTALSACAE